MTPLTSDGRSRLRAAAIAAFAPDWPHVGECGFAGVTPRIDGMVKQRNGGRVSAAGDAM
ncbi:MAG TPA: hypothetical protein VMN56_12740 [Casimicrobiaceae bacterium]|nr:hypothetical protein [Casimicrobiaceae bacterium]